jgi:hypothetical protein
MNLIVCTAHRNELDRHGRIRERKNTMPNEIRKNGKYYEMDLYNQKQEITATAIFDQSDMIGEVRRYKWHLSTLGYVRALPYVNGIKKSIFLHTLLMPHPHGTVTDHINGDKLDNRATNLRIATPQENCVNRRTSRGYMYDPRKEWWRAYIKVNGKWHEAAPCHSEEEAKAARLALEQKYHPGIKYRQ